jgi:hypothetical protein
MPVFFPPSVADPSNVVFFDDFTGSVYNSRVWAVTGTGSAALQNSLSGRILITGNTGLSYRINHGNLGAFSVAQLAKVQWRGSLVSPASGTGGLAECGLQSTSAPTTTSVRWNRTRGTTNFQCYCQSAGTGSPVDSGVVADSNDHDFRIECYSGSVLFFLDGVLRATITTNITANQLQPFVNCTGSTLAAATANMDYVDARGVRA